MRRVEGCRVCQGVCKVLVLEDDLFVRVFIRHFAISFLDHVLHGARDSCDTSIAILPTILWEEVPLVISGSLIILIPHRVPEGGPRDSDD